MKSCVAYIDDLEQNLECVKQILLPEYDVITFLNPYNFLDSYNKSNYTCILSDIHMPKLCGFALYEKIIDHPQYNGCPILFISSDETDFTRIKSLILGAVDFINRDANPDEILCRIKAKIEFFDQHRPTLEWGNLKVNLKFLKVYIKEVEIPVTFIELKFLCFILKANPRILSKSEIVEKVWNNPLVLDATISTHLSNLNGKLSKWNFAIRGIKAKGFRIIKKRSGE